MDRVLRHAIQQGLKPISALQMATLNTAEHFGLAREVGQIAPGRYADILILRDLAQFEIETVIAKGVRAVEAGETLVASPSISYPSEVKNSVNLKRPLTAEDFLLEAPEVEEVEANVIGIIENQAPTRHLQLRLPVVGGRLHADIEKDIAKVALVERHDATGEVVVGLVKGFGLSVPCAIASTVAHDSHHMIVVGTEESDMALAANELAERGGGQIVVREGEVIGLVELPIAGLMSDERAETVAAKASGVLDAFRSCGCELNNPNMQLSLLALVVIPALRISDKGLVDVTTFEVIPVVVPG
jgi:adenine deaminase